MKNKKCSKSRKENLKKHIKLNENITKIKEIKERIRRKMNKFNKSS